MAETDSRPGLPIVLVSSALAVDPTGRLPLVRNLGNWWLPGGRVEADESFVAAAVRETEEETGLRLEPAGIVLVTQQMRPDRHVIFVIVRGTVAGDLTAPVDDPKIDAARWATVAEAQELLAGFDEDLAVLLKAAPIQELTL